MPLLRAQRALANARAEIIRLRLEVSRLEHALTTATVLSAVLVTPEQRALNLAKDLTPRESEVLIRIMAGDTVDQMAKRLYMSASTVKAHIVRIYHKTGAHNRGGAVMAGIQLGLDVPPEEKHHD